MFFFVSCIPPTKTSQQKGVARTRRTTRNRRGLVFFEREDVKKERERIRDLFTPFQPLIPYDGPVGLNLTFVFPYLKGTPKRITKAGDLTWHTGKPDFDNAAKGICDLLQDLGFVTQDNHITLGSVLKAHGPEALTGIGVHLRPMDTDESPVLRKMRECILAYQRAHPADRSTCPRCWHTFGRAIPMPPAGQRCHKCGRVSDLPEPTEPDLFDDSEPLIDPDDLFTP